MRYLLDELMAYEEGFSDILLLDRASDRHETFMGGSSPSVTVSHSDLQVFGENLLQQFRDLLPTLSPMPTMDGGQIRHGFVPSNMGFTQSGSPQPLAAAVSCRGIDASKCTLLSSHPKCSPIPSSRVASTMGGHCSRSGVPRIPKTTSLDDALQYWEKGNASLGLTVPLKKWSTIYSPSEYRSEAQKLSMIHIVRDEFVDNCNADWNVFEEHYPGLRDQYTKLVKAVRRARIIRGDVRSRCTRRP